MSKEKFGPPMLAWGVLFFFSLTAIPAWAGGTGKVTGTARARGVKNPADVVVYIEKVEGKFQPPKSPVRIDQIKRTYVPHVLGALVGTTIEFHNSDNDLHNIHARQRRRKLFNFGILPKRKIRKKLKRVGLVTLLCDVHPEMSAYVVVTQNPFFAKPDNQGNYRIENIPPGTYTLVAWHEKRKSQSRKIKISEAGEVRVDFDLRR
ncbi:MAG: carboxypeptidase regulatory-like domain-containing protein [Candidatus Binatia bacterium]